MVMNYLRAILGFGSVALLCYGRNSFLKAYRNSQEFNRNPAYVAALNDSRRLRSFSEPLSRIDSELVSYAIHESRARTQIGMLLENMDDGNELTSEMRDIYNAFPSHAKSELKKMRAIEKRADVMADARLNQIPEDLRPKDIDIYDAIPILAFMLGATGFVLSFVKLNPKK